MYKKKGVQSNKIDRYMKNRQNIFTQKLEEEFKAIQQENSEKSKEESQNDELLFLRVKHQELLGQNSKLLKDNKLLKKLLEECKSLNFQKDLQIKKLQAQNRSQKTGNLFEQFEKYFLPIELNQLRSINKGERHDSTFVTKCLTFLYGGSLLTGKVATSAKVPYGKKPISPEKVGIISAMLADRVNSEEPSSELAHARCNRLTKLLQNAITNANRSKVKIVNSGKGLTELNAVEFKGNGMPIMPIEQPAQISSTHPQIVYFPMNAVNVLQPFQF